MDGETLYKISEILVVLEKRIGALEDRHARIAIAIRDAQNASNRHGKAIGKLETRMTREIHGVLDAVDDLQDMLTPVYERVMPGIGPFNKELDRVIARYRRSRPGDKRDKG